MVVIIDSEKKRIVEISELVNIAKALSHRLNNALSIILTNSQLVINKINRIPQATDELQNYLYSIESVAIKSGSLIHQFQEFLDYILDQQLNEKNSSDMEQIIENLQELSEHNILYTDKNSSRKSSIHNNNQDFPTRVGHISIMIVDDEKEIRHALSYALTLGGHHVITAPDGKSALEILQKRHYEVVFVDLKMPGMNGLELARAIKQIDPDIGVILMTGWNVKLDREEFGGNIVNGLLPKPFVLSEVYDLITNTSFSSK